MTIKIHYDRWNKRKDKKYTLIKEHIINRLTLQEKNNLNPPRFNGLNFWWRSGQVINMHICVPVLIQWPIPGMIWVLSSYISSAKSVIVVYSQCAGGYIQGEQPWRRYILGEHRYQSGYGSRYQYGHPTWMLILFFWTNYEFWKFCVFENFGFLEKFGFLEIAKHY